jgi:hypothetical protein
MMGEYEAPRLTFLVHPSQSRTLHTFNLAHDALPDKTDVINGSVICR